MARISHEIVTQDFGKKIYCSLAGSFLPFSFAIGIVEKKSHAISFSSTLNWYDILACTKLFNWHR